MIRIQQLNLEIPFLKTEDEYDKFQNIQLEKKIIKLLKITIRIWNPGISSDVPWMPARNQLCFTVILWMFALKTRQKS